MKVIFNVIKRTKERKMNMSLINTLENMEQIISLMLSVSIVIVFVISMIVIKDELL